MNKKLFEALDMLESEKGIPKEYMYEKLEAALVNAYRREMGGSTNVRVQINEEKFDLKVYKQLEVVEEVTDPVSQISLEDAKRMSKRHTLGKIIEIEVKPDDFRRLSALTGKQVIVQAIREAERGLMMKEYEEKKEEIVTAVVDRIDEETGNVRMLIGNGHATLLKAEQIPGETFEVGQHIKVYLIEIKKEAMRPFATFSRTHSGLVKRLFELNIPEVADGTVIIKNVAREAGSRTKIAVFSRDEDVDAVGACIGNHGMRISGIVDELRGEKIDIVKYSEVPEEYVAAALAPAEVRSVTFTADRACRVVVDADQLSLAIGKEGQNARLAARLTGMKIDIKAE